jgi:hypothetical protein
MLERKNTFPEGLSKRIVGGHVLYSPVVTVVPSRLIFVSGLLARKSIRICGYAPLPYRAVSAPEGNY